MPATRVLDRLAELAPWLWGLAGAGACALVIGFEPSLLEEGAHVHVAQRLVHGERLYQHVLVFTGPLPFQALALLFRLLGEEIAVGRATIAALHGLSTAVAVLLAGRRSPGGLVAGAAMAAAPILLFPVFSIFYYTTLAFHASVLAAGCAVRGSRSPGWAAAAGALAVAAGLSKQTIGAGLAPLLLVALLAGASRERRRALLLAFAAGGLAMAGVSLGWIALESGIDDFFRATVLLPSALEQTYRSSFMNFWPPGRFAPAIRAEQNFYLPFYYILVHGVFAVPGWRIALATQAAYALPLVALGALVLRRTRGPLAPATRVAAALLLAWITNLFPRTDWGHLAHVLPLAVLSLAGLSRATTGRRHRAAWAAAGLCAVALAGSAWAGRALLDRLADPPHRLGPRVSQRPVSQGLRGDAVARVVGFLRERVTPGEAIFVARAEPLLYFATETRNPTPYPGLIPAALAEQERVILAALERVRFVVMSDVDQRAMNYYAAMLPAVQAYLERHFRVVPELQRGEVHWLTLLERSGDRGETLLDLRAELERGRPWTRDRNGREHAAQLFTEPVGTKLNRRPLAFHLGEQGGGIDFDLVVPEQAVFEAGVGLWRIEGIGHVYPHAPGARLRVSVGSGDALEVLADVQPTRRPWSGRWRSLELDLARYAGQRVTLRLELVPARPIEPGQIGYWGSPRIARRLAAQ